LDANASEHFGLYDGERPSKDVAFIAMIAVAFLLLLCLACLLLAWIDLRHGIIPDWLNLAIAAIGLARAAILDDWPMALSAAAEGILTGAIVWSLRWLYFQLRQRQGLGLGDVKLLAASAISVGIAGIPMLLLIASLTALVAAGVLYLAGEKMTRQTALPFGPFLALGLLTTLALQQTGWAIY
jgi:leader peptidase (prepilin peptidase) / N-methyltransferase